MSSLDLSVRLRADGSGLVGEVRASKEEIEKLTGKIDKADNSSKKLTSSTGRLTGSMNGLKAAFASLGIGLFVRSVTNAGISMQGFNLAMRASIGDSAQAAREINYVRNEAERLGLEFETTVGAYTSLAAAAKGTALEGQAARDVFTAVAEASTALQLSSEQTEGALKALEQMISKGNVQAEELRGQLGERIPGAFNIAARAMGVTTSELNDMLDNGQVLAGEMLPKLATELRKTFGSGVAEASQSASAEINRLKNAFFNLKDDLAKAGLLDGVVASARFLTDAIKAIPDVMIDLRIATVAMAADLEKRWEQVKFGFNAMTTAIEVLWNNVIRNIKLAIADHLDDVANGMLTMLPGMEKYKQGMQLVAQSYRKAIPAAKDLNLEIFKLNVAHQTELKTIERNAEEYTAYQLTLKSANKAKADSTAAATNNTSAKKGNTEATKELTKAEQALLEAIDPDGSALDKYNDQLNELWGIKEKLGWSTEQYQYAVDKLTESYLGLGDATAEATTKATEAIDPMVKAYENAATGIQGAFSSFFENIFDKGMDSFKDLARGIWDTFKKMLAQMATLAIARPIIVPITAGLGSSLGLSQTAIQGVTGGLGGSGGLSSLAGIGSGAAAFGQGLSLTGSFIGSEGLLGGLTQGFGAGISEIFGGGSILGGLGMALPVLGIVAGLASLFKKSKTPKATLGSGDIDYRQDFFKEGVFGKVGFANKGTQAIGVDKNYGDFLEGILGYDATLASRMTKGQIEATRAGLDGFTSSTQKGKKNIDTGALLQERTVAILQAIGNEWSNLVRVMEGSPEEIGTMATTLIDLQNALDADVVADYTEAQRQAGLTLYESAQEQAAGIYQLLDAYDGSLAATQELSAATQNRYAIEMQLLAQIDAAIASVNGTLDKTIESIRLSSLTEEEKYERMRTQATELSLALESMIDPAKINATVQEINNLASQAFNTLSEEQKARVDDGLIEFLEGVKTTANERLALAKEEAVTTATEIRSAIREELGSVAAQMGAAADKMMAAASAIPDTIQVVGAEPGDVNG